VGPCVARGLDYTAAAGLTVEGWVNGTRRQFSSTRELIFVIPKLIEYISTNMTLLPGDIISTGTPSGIGALNAGDTVTIKVEGVGELTNDVRSADISGEQP
jgi:2-keto-4-pentenoate hydratase/2-oxohepta-3-ene-1,7-dioic acid hydratase in catechol pathway